MKDILDAKNGVVSLQDPIFAYWLRTYYYQVVSMDRRLQGRNTARTKPVLREVN